jgi:hypothetical protein
LQWTRSHSFRSSLPNPSSCTLALGFTQPLTKRVPRIFLKGKARAENLTSRLRTWLQRVGTTSIISCVHAPNRVSSAVLQLERVAVVIRNICRSCLSHREKLYITAVREVTPLSANPHHSLYPSTNTLARPLTDAPGL